MVVKKSSDYSKKIVALIIGLNVIFTIGMALLILKSGIEPSTLETCWFSFTGVELAAMAGIKISGR